VVVNSDYASTNVAVVGADGAVLSRSLLSSASAGVGASAALSGDVVPPREPPASGLVVLIDRYPNSVVTWVDPAAARVVGQLSVATGFASNPHDYLEVGGAKAYVTRYETNAAAGREPFDGGGDVLVVDRERRAVVGRVDLGAEAGGGFLPRPNRLARAGGEAVVALDRFDAGFGAALDARLVGVDVASDAIAWRLDVAGLANCGGLALSPGRTLLALACSGPFAGGAAGQRGRSGLVVLDLSTRPPAERARFDLAARFGAPLAPGLAFASETVLVGTAYGDLEAGRPDVAFALDLASGDALPLAEAAAFSFGDVWCTPGCGDACFLADADRNALRRWRVDGAALAPEADVRVDTLYGLPPRALGAY
jgi:hypothetical protein